MFEKIIFSNIRLAYKTLKLIKSGNRILGRLGALLGSYQA